MTVTDVLAIIGAITGVTGTLLGLTALIWDFYKWRYSERVRLKVWASGGHVTNHNRQDNLIRISITNVGKVGTTIQAISLNGFNSKEEMKKRYSEPVAVIHNPLFATLPARIEPGNEWNGCIYQDRPEIQKFLKFKYFILQVEDSISGKQFRAEIDKATIDPTLKNKSEHDTLKS
jgi:hypothetical protein